MRRLTNSCAIVAVCLAATIAGANAETFVLETGESFEGAIVRSVGGTVSIKLTERGVRQLPRAHIRRIEVPIEGDYAIRGTLAAWSNGIYEILSGDRLIKVRSGRILSDSLAAPAASESERQAPTTAATVAPTTDPEEVTSEPVEATPVAATNRVVVLVGSAEPANEGAGDVVFKLSLSVPAPRPVVVVYSTINGTAREGEDYQSTSGVLTIIAGGRTAEIAIPLIDDQDAEDDEQFELYLLADSNVVETDHPRIAAIIRDDD